MYGAQIRSCYEICNGIIYYFQAITQSTLPFLLIHSVQGFAWNSATPTVSCWDCCDCRLPGCVCPEAVRGLIMIKLTVFLGIRIAIFIRRESPTVSHRLAKRLRARKKGGVICSDSEQRKTWIHVTKQRYKPFTGHLNIIWDILEFLSAPPHH